MQHPFTLLPPSSWPWLCWPLSGAALLLWLMLERIDRPLRGPSAQRGIVSFEVARTSTNAGAILRMWRQQSVLPAARAGLLLDFPFIATYAPALAFGSLMTGSALLARSWPLAAAAEPLAWAALLAGALDVVEDLALLRELLADDPTQPWPTIAYLAALAKFALIILTGLYSLYGLIAHLTA